MLYGDGSRWWWWLGAVVVVGSGGLYFRVAPRLLTVFSLISVQQVNIMSDIKLLPNLK